VRDVPLVPVVDTVVNTQSGLSMPMPNVFNAGHRRGCEHSFHSKRSAGLCLGLCDCEYGLHSSFHHSCPPGGTVHHGPAKLCASFLGGPWEGLELLETREGPSLTPLVLQAGGPKRAIPSRMPPPMGLIYQLKSQGLGLGLGSPS